MKNNHLSQYEQEKAKKQLKSWDRYVQAKVILRRMKKQGHNIDHLLEYLEGKHYTLTEEQLNKIKEYVVNK